MKRVGLLGPPDRLEIERLAIRLEERGAEPVLLDSRRDPAIEIGRGRIRACDVELTSLDAVYVSDLGIPPPHPQSADRADIDGALARSRRFLAAWNAALDRLARTRRVVNPPETHDLHALKPYEISTYRKIGVTVPLTISTSDPAALRSLPALGRGWITKGMTGGYSHTEAVDEPSSDEAALRLADLGCVMIQERIEGDNVRAFVLGGRVIGAAEIIPTSGSEIDSRRGDTRMRPLELPVEAREGAAATARCWGMAFAAVDFMREAGTARFVVLECNSAPFFVTFEARTGVEVSGPLANYLLEQRR